MGIDVEAELQQAYEFMLKAFSGMVLVNSEKRSRELSVAITEVETAMMWLNKDRAVRGLLPKSDTHVEATNA